MKRLREGGLAVWRALASLKLTIAALLALMIVVTACTLAQVRLGNYEAVRRFIDTAWISWRGVPVFPGGGLVVAVLLVNLAAAQLSRLELSRRKAGLWLCHLGLILLFAGGIFSAWTRVEGVIVLSPGKTRSHVESVEEAQLSVQEPSTGLALELPETLWKSRPLSDPRLPFRVEVLSSSVARGEDDRASRVSARVRLVGADGAALGQRRLEPGLSEPVRSGARTFVLRVEPRRRPLGYALTLERFSRAYYPGSDIPKSFSSRVELDDPGAGERRSTLISMNNPLRYRGRAFYQASFIPSTGDSVLQVVQDPSWRMPYAACALVAAGLLLHFLLRLAPGREGAR